MKKLISFIAVLMFVFALFAMPAMAAKAEFEGPGYYQKTKGGNTGVIKYFDNKGHPKKMSNWTLIREVDPPGCLGGCPDNVISFSSGSFNAFDSDDFNKDNGKQGAGAFAGGNAGGDFSAFSTGDKFAHTSGFGFGHVSPNVYATKGGHWVNAGASASAGSMAGALAMNDGGYRDAYANVYGNVYQSHGAYTTDGDGNFASGGNESGAAYSNSDGRSYDGEWGLAWHWIDLGKWGGFWLPLPAFGCEPGMIAAFTAGGAYTAGSTFVYSRNYGDSAVSFGKTGNFAIGNDGVFGSGNMSTGAFVSNGASGASAYTTGSFLYSGSGFGAGMTYGGSVVSIGNGSASVYASHTSMATGNDGNYPQAD